MHLYYDCFKKAHAVTTRWVSILPQEHEHTGPCFTRNSHTRASESISSVARIARAHKTYLRINIVTLCIQAAVICCFRTTHIYWAQRVQVFAHASANYFKNENLPRMQEDLLTKTKFSMQLQKKLPGVLLQFWSQGMLSHSLISVTGDRHIKWR